MAHFFEKEVIGEKIDENRVDWPMRRQSALEFRRTRLKNQKTAAKQEVLRHSAALRFDAAHQLWPNLA